MDSKNKTSYLFILLYLVFITCGSLSAVPLKVEIPNWDKVIHMLLYIPLGFFLSLPKIYSCSVLNFFVPLGFVSLYGGILELLQHLVPGRAPSWYDEIANVIGAGIGLSLGFLLKNKQRGEKREES